MFHRAYRCDPLALGIGSAVGARYTVTATPVNLSGNSILVSASRLTPPTHKVWWWELTGGPTNQSYPNHGYASDCSRRSTGPEVLR